MIRCRADHKQFEVTKGKAKKAFAPDSDDSDDNPAPSDQAVVKETPMPEVGKERSYWMKQEVFAKGKSGEASNTDGEQENKSGFSFGFGNGENNEASGED